MTITFALMRSFVAAYLVGIGIGMLLMGAVRVVRSILNVTD